MKALVDARVRRDDWSQAGPVPGFGSARTTSTQARDLETFWDDLRCPCVAR